MILSTILSPASSCPPLSLRHPPQCRRCHHRGSSICPFPFTGTILPLSQFRQALRRSSAKSTEVHQPTKNSAEKGEDENEVPPEDIKVLTAVRSSYNDIMILETPDSRMLLLDSSQNVHSIFNKAGNKWTNSYWDEFATLPPIVPNGPIAIFGLGGGTTADLILEIWPSLQLEGWEIDEILIDKARDYLGLSELEKCNEAGGRLKVLIGDALSANASIAGGYAGIIVDLFSNGGVLPELEKVETWMQMREKLMPNGRIVVNCGGVSEAGSLDWEQNYALRALNKAFPAELNWKLLPENKGANFLGLTGALPDLSAWSSALPHELRSSVHQWRICLPS